MSTTDEAEAMQRLDDMVDQVFAYGPSKQKAVGKDEPAEGESEG